MRASPEVCNLGVFKPLNIQTMHFTKVQISELMRKHAEKENGLHDLMEIMLESMMVAERSEFLQENPSNKGNGYRPGHAYGQGRKLEFRIPRDCHGNFHPRILAILRNQEEECDRLAGALYTKGLTQKQVGDVFDHLWPALFQVQYQQDGRKRQNADGFMAGTRSGKLLPCDVRRLRAHQDPPQTFGIQ